MAFRISFSTPEGEVNGVEPVKFMAKYELTAIVNTSNANAPKPPICRHDSAITHKLKNKPVRAPLTEKESPGIQGSNAGVITAPAKMPAKREISAVNPFDHAMLIEKIFGLMPDKIKMAGTSQPIYFLNRTISTGISTSRSESENVT